MKKGKFSAIVGLIIFVFLILTRLLLGEEYVDGTVIGKDKLLEGFGWFEELFNGQSSELVNSTAKGEIHYLDVGQGDTIYLKIGNWDILVDTGPRSAKDELLAQLSTYNIDDFELVIVTHPHEDHIGGIPDVFTSYDVESFYMPQVTHTTKIFESMVTAIQNEGLKINTLKEGTSMNFGADGGMKVLNSMSASDNLNNYSPVIKFNIGEVSAIMSGDAERPVEEEVLSKYPKDLNADIYKFAHHGSTTSNSREFLDAISPTYGVISCGVDNKYGQPHKEIIKDAKSRKLELYRTDNDGQVSFYIDGDKVQVECAK